MARNLIRSNKNKIHLGCGRTILKDYINVDIVDSPGVDLVCDITQGIDFEDNSFIEALAVDFIEHIPPTRVIHVMNEVYRILVPGGILKIHVPEAPGITAYQDPTHVSFWNEESFTYFLADHHRYENYGKYYGINARFKIVSLTRKHHLWRRFFRTLNVNYLANYVIDVELEAVK